MRSSIVPVMAGLVIALAGVTAEPALASNAPFCSSVYLESAQTCADPNQHSYLIQVTGRSIGSAATCAGVYGSNSYTVCGGGGDPATTGYLGFPARGAIHNHSTFPSRFNGTVYWS